MSKTCLGCMEQYDDKLDICPNCGYAEGTPAADPMSLKPGTVLNGRYLIGKMDAATPVTAVYTAYDTAKKQKVAVTEYLPFALSARAGDGASLSAASEADKQLFSAGMTGFIDERRALAAAQKSEGMTKIFSIFAENSTVYSVSEYLSGELLESLLNREGKLPAAEAVKIIGEVITALKNVRIAAVENTGAQDVMLTAQGVRLISLGLARGAAVPSLSRDTSAHADVYAVGVMFCRMAAGITPPLMADRLKAVNSGLPDPFTAEALSTGDMPENMKNAVIKALSLDAESRQPSLDAFLRSLSRPAPAAAPSAAPAAAAFAAPAPMYAPVTQAPRKSADWKKPAAILLVIASIVIFMFGGYLSFSFRQISGGDTAVSSFQELIDQSGKVLTVGGFTANDIATLKNFAVILDSGKISPKDILYASFVINDYTVRFPALFSTETLKYTRVVIPFLIFWNILLMFFAALTVIIHTFADKGTGVNITYLVLLMLSVAAQPLIPVITSTSRYFQIDLWPEAALACEIVALVLWLQHRHTVSALEEYAPTASASYAAPAGCAAPVAEQTAPAGYVPAAAAPAAVAPATVAAATVAPATKFCTHCGAKLKADSAFCTHCGAQQKR
jgi:hypothetical protein